ncbi:DNA primase [Burkholderiaceae bacterium FT117]|uniref:DNA primase n=1 Tax=Zeimonas sediminis TaxID=2944268 RepID=UPI002342FBDD|nr:DNA primase [Zeimonas sediminis]MCM5570508.1 DNA primase [Zeimonas sediminis]
MIPQSFIQDLLARVDIVDVVGRYVRLKKAGANYLGLCPFHAEKSPSFTVSPTKQFYHCFGCGAHGSAIGFLMEHAGLGYVDAVTDLARSLGLEVPREPGTGGGRGPDPRAPGLLELLARAAQFYRGRLKDSPRAIDYLKGRGLTGEVAARFGIGYAPDQWRGLEAAVPDYDDPALVEAGLVIDSDGDDGRKRRYDRFRDRVMFPIRNPRGQVIGFGGRILDRGEPKYLNSPETPVFSKGRELYGLFEARDAIRRENCVLVVEGYMDVVMLARHGVGNAVATLGTSTTPDHVRKLLRLADRVVFAFDGDAAGRKAAWRALEASLPQTADAKRIDFLFLPPEHDPDSFVREHGAEGFREALAGAMPLSELMVRELSERVGLETPEGRARLLAEAAPLLHALAAPALKLQLVHRIAELAKLAVAEVDRYLAEAAAQSARVGQPQGRTPGAPRGADGGGGGGAASGAHHPGGGPAAEGPPWEQGPGQGGWQGPGQGGWQGRSGRWRGPAEGRRGFDRPVPRPPVARPDLEARLRLLVALHPGLASAVEKGEWLSPELVDWIDTVAALPPGSTAGNVVESLRQGDPASVRAFERAMASDAAALADLSAAEAAAELSAAVDQLRDRHIRRQIDELARGGLRTEADRERYQALMALRARS